MSFLNFSLLLLLLLCMLSTAPGEKVRVSLYYESLCPFSKEFIVNHLAPGMGQIGNYVKLHFVPFGNAKIDPVTKNVTCKHGPNECYANKVHACAIEDYTQKHWLDFIHCSIGQEAPYDDVVNEKCALRSKLSWDELKTCADGGDGDKLILQYGEEARKADSHYTPHIVFNGVVNKTLEGYSRQNFTATVCSLLTKKPKACGNDFE